MEVVKTIAILSFESKKLVGRLKHRNKRIRENCYALIKKRYIKGEKHIVEMDFAEYFKKSDFSGNSKVYYVQFI